MILVAWPSATFCMASMDFSFSTASLGAFSFSIARESASAYCTERMASASPSAFKMAA